MYLISFLSFHYLAGWMSFSFWWTRDFPIEEAKGTRILAAITGPMAWFMGYSIHSKGRYNFFGNIKN